MQKHAIVIGGSMAGLLAARVLPDRFERVTLIERDVFPTPGENRRGVPQGRHTHGLLGSGRAVLEDLFPGITQELIQAGAVPCDPVLDGRWFHEGGCLHRSPSGLAGMLASRPFLEGFVRSRVLSLANIHVLENREVKGLLATADRSQVTGVRLDTGEMTADLVVDATGRGSHSAGWLINLGYDPPNEERVEVTLGYTTRFFRHCTAQLGGDTIAVIPPTPQGRRGGVMLAQECDRWTVTLIGYGAGNYAPPDVAGYVEFARSLPAPYIYDVVRQAEPLGDAYIARFPASVRRRYEKLARFPEGYLVTGDALCSFNPIYGQGMSVAALEAIALGETLNSGDRELARRFFRRIAKIIDIPWNMATGADFRLPGTVGKRPPGVGFIHWYLAHYHKAAHHDPVLSGVFHQVTNLLAPPSSLMSPRLAWRVFRPSHSPASMPPAYTASTGRLRPDGDAYAEHGAPSVHGVVGPRSQR